MAKKQSRTASEEASLDKVEGGNLSEVETTEVEDKKVVLRSVLGHRLTFRISGGDVTIPSYQDKAAATKLTGDNFEIMGNIVVISEEAFEELKSYPLFKEYLTDSATSKASIFVAEKIPDDYLSSSVVVANARADAEKAREELAATSKTVEEQAAEIEALKAKIAQLGG